MHQFQKSIRPLEGDTTGLQSNCRRRDQAWEHLGAPTTSQGALGSAGDKSGSTPNHSRAVWEYNIFFGNAAGAPGNLSYYLSFNNFQISCRQFVLTSMYLYSDPFTHGISQLPAGRALEEFEVCLKWTNE
jgi:hypothetical protein